MTSTARRAETVRAVDELAGWAADWRWGEAPAPVAERVRTALDLDDIADTSRWNDAVSRVLAELRADGATAILSGCSAVEVTTEPTPGITVVDPAATALQLLGTS